MKNRDFGVVLSRQVPKGSQGRINSCKNAHGCVPGRMRSAFSFLLALFVCWLIPALVYRGLKWHMVFHVMDTRREFLLLGEKMREDEAVT